MWGQKNEVGARGLRVMPREPRDWRQRYESASRVCRRPWSTPRQKKTEPSMGLGSSLVETLAKSANKMRNRKIQAHTTRRYLMADRPLR